MGNCCPTRTRRRIHQLPSRSYRPIVTKESDSTDHLELNEDSGTDIDHSSVDNEGYKAVIACHNKLVTALATDYLTVAGTLLARGFVSEELPAKMLLPHSTPIEKATILITAVRERIKVAPQQFPVLLSILSEHASTECVVKLLQSTYQGEIKSCIFCAILCMQCAHVLLCLCNSNNYD